LRLDEILNTALQTRPIRIVERDEYRQQDVFDTVLDLLSIESPVVDRSRSFVKREDVAAPAANRN